MTKRFTVVLDAETLAALCALRDEGIAASGSEAVRDSIRAYVRARLPAWRYSAPVDPRQRTLFDDEDEKSS